MVLSSKGRACISHSVKGADLMGIDIEAILEKPTCSVEEFRKIFGLSKNPAYDAVRRGDVRSVRIGGCIRIPTAPLKVKLGLGPPAPETIPADALRDLLRGAA
jgi:hypothetical protein